MGSEEKLPSQSLTRDTLLKLLGTFPDRCSPDAETIETVGLGDLRREKIRFQVEPGESATGYLFVPKARQEPGPAMLCLHQHAGQFQLGKSEPAGLGGNPEQHYALELARRGYVTFTFDFICFEDRRHSTLEGGNYERFEFTRRISAGSSLQAKMTSDAMRSLDYLTGRPEVDPTRIGCVGHSLGGQQTLFLAALDERVKAAISSCGFASFETIFRDAINHNFSAYVPGILNHGDLGDVLALVAPRAFRVSVGNADRIFPFDGIRATVERAEETYRARGAEDRLVLDAVDGGHAFSDAMRERAYSWLDRELGKALDFSPGVGAGH
jgi:dienelactone hydrolase